MSTKEEIRRAVDNQEWQIFRISLKGKPTARKLELLKKYWEANGIAQMVMGNIELDYNDDVVIRLDNYIKALCRGGQLYAGESLETALTANWNLLVRK